MKYAYWRTDKPKENGFSHELVAYESDALLDGRTDLETLDVQPYPGINTVLKAVYRNVERIPNNDFLGTRKGNEYEWITWRDGVQMAEELSHGLVAYNLIPELDGEGDGKQWRFMGAQSKNRAEWTLMNLACMHQGCTMVALYDTLGPEAIRYIFDQTQMTTLSIS